MYLWHSPVCNNTTPHNRNEFVHVMKTSRMCACALHYTYIYIQSKRRRARVSVWRFGVFDVAVWMVEPSLYCIYSTFRSVWSARFNFTQHDESADIIYRDSATISTHLEYIASVHTSTIRIIYITCWRINTVWKKNPEDNENYSEHFYHQHSNLDIVLLEELSLSHSGQWPNRITCSNNRQWFTDNRHYISHVTIRHHVATA